MSMADNSDFIIKQDPFHKGKFFLHAYLGKESVVKVPDGVVKISSYAFADEDNPNDTITKIILPDSVEEIEKLAFGYCTALKEIRWPENEELWIGLNIFEGCRSLEKISIPKNVIRLDSFKMPRSLKTVEVHDDLISIEGGIICFYYEGDDAMERTFHSQTVRILLQNPTYKVIDGFMVNTKHKVALFYVARNQKKVRVPDGVKVIGTSCFDESGYLCPCPEELEMMMCGTHCENVEEVVLPKSVRKIEFLAFLHCEYLCSMIYEGKTADLTVEEEAFMYCPKIERLETKIKCSDSERLKKAKCRKFSEELSRILLIDQKIRSGAYPNVDKLAAEHNVSVATIHRDLDKILEFSGTDCIKRKDLIKYDHYQKGYYYAKDFTLDIEATLMSSFLP